VLQVLSNLVGNALKFAPESSTVAVELTASGPELVVCVRDSGPGINVDEIPLLFEKYWQGSGASARQGVGLGLAIARAIVLAHGGRIWVESQRGEGSRFYFTIPTAPAVAADPPRQPESGPPQSGHPSNDLPDASGAGLTIACRGA
jgi:signal transduction histidine kinase